MSIIEIIIPNWRPALLNQYIHKHWSVGHKLKNRDKAIVFAYSYGKPQAQKKRRVDVHIVLGPRQQESDDDAPQKSLLDALVFSKMLLNDSRAFVEMGKIMYSRGAPETRITLTDI